MRRVSLAMLALLVLGAVPNLPSVVSANSGLCGATLTTSVTLSSDLDCGPTGVSLSGPGLTFDCAGHKVTSSGTGIGTHIGINVRHSKHTTVTNCTVTGFQVGIEMSSSSKSTIMNNLVESIGLANSSAFFEGISVDNGSSNSIIGNRVISNPAAWSSSGFSINSKSAFVSSNSAYNQVDGFDVLRSMDTLQNNVAVNSSFAGFWVLGNSNRLIGNNATDSPVGLGFQVDGAKNVLSGNLASGDADGFFIDGRSNKLFSNEAAGSTGNDSLIGFIGGMGFALQFANSNLLAGNLAIDNAGDGFNDLASAGVVYMSNTATGNGHSGFNLSQTLSARLVGNTATANLRSGFFDNASSKAVMKSDSANNNTEDGFGLFNTIGDKVTMSNSTGNLGNGFSIVFGTRNSLLNDRGVGNWEDGFLVGNAMRNTIGTDLASVNGGLGFEDNTTGSKDFGTSNSYRADVCVNNFGGAATPVGLCPYSGVSAGTSTPESYGADQGQTLSVHVTANPVGGTAPYTYQWYTGVRCTSPIPGAVSQSYSAVVNSSTTFYYKVTAADSTFACSRGTPVTFNLPLNATFFHPTWGYVNWSLYLVPMVRNGTEPYHYQWYTGNDCQAPNVIAGQTLSFLVIPNFVHHANYSVSVTDSSQGTPAEMECASTQAYATGFPAGIAVDPVTHAVYVSDYLINRVSAASGTSRALLGGGPTGTSPFPIAANPTNDEVYVANEGSNSVSVLNGSNYSTITTIAGISFPTHIAVDPGTSMVYVSQFSGGMVTVINGTTNTIATTLNVGLNVQGIAVDTSTNLVYVSHGDNMSVIDSATNKVEANILIGIPLSGLSVDTSTHAVYIASYFSNTVTVVNGTSDSVISTISDVSSVLAYPFSGPSLVVVNSNTHMLYALDVFGQVTLINGTSDSIVKTINIYPEDFGIAVDPGLSVVYVSSLLTGSLYVIDGSTNSLSGNIYLF